MKILQVLQQKKERFLTANYRKSILFIFAIMFLAAYFSYLLLGTDFSVKEVLNTDEFFYSKNGKYVEGLGYCIDETADLNENNIFCGYNDITLHKGSYRVTIDYITDGEDNICYFESPDDSFNSLVSDPFNLRSDLTSISGIIKINDSRDDYRFRAAYGGTGMLTIKNILIEQTNNYLLNICTSFVLWGLIVIALYTIYKSSKTKSQKQRNVMFGLLLICLGSSLPLYVDYLFNSHDLVFHLSRIEGIKNGLLSGMFPVKIYSNFLQERGYTSVMYGDIFLYIPALLRMLGYTITDSYRIFVFGVNVVTCLVSYWCIKKISQDEYIGLLGSGLYTLSAYRFTNIYVRAAVGEYTAMIFLPFIFCGLYFIFNEEENDSVQNEGVILSVIGFSGIIQTHVLTCEMVGIFTIIACVLLWKRTLRKKTFFSLTKVVLFASVINLWWLVPFFDYRGEELRINYSDPPHIQQMGNFIAQIFMPFANASGVNLAADAGVANEMPLNLGLSLTCGILLFFYLFFFGKKISDKKFSKLAVFSMFMGILALFMSTIYFPYDKLSDFSSFIHKYLPVIEFPWRFLVIATIFITISTCITIILFKRFYKQEIVTILVLLIGIGTLIPYSYSVYSLLNTEDAYRPYDILTLTKYANGVGEYLPLGAETFPSSSPNYFLGEGVNLKSYTKKDLEIKLEIENNAQTESYIEVPLLYYKGYVAVSESDHAYLPVCKSEKGHVQVVLPSGYNGQITVSFKEPWYWRMAEICSLLMLIILFVYKVLKKRTSKIRKAELNGV